MPDRQTSLYDFSGLTKREEPVFNPLPAVMDQAVQVQPSQYAESLRISQQLGIPTEAVQSDLPTMRNQAKIQTYDFTGLSTRSPVTGSFLVDYNNAVLAQNDIPILEKMESVLVGTGDVLRSPFAGALEFVGMGVAGLGESINVGGRTLARAADFLLPEAADKFIWENPADKYLQAVDPAAFLRARGEGASELAEMARAPEERRNYLTAVSEGVGQLLGQAVLYSVAPQAALPMLFGQGVEQQLDRQQETGTAGESLTTDAGLVLGGLATMATERLGIEELLNRIPPKVKNDTARAIADVFIAGGIEGVQEIVEGVTQSLIERFTSNPDAALLENAAEEGAVGFGVGAIARALVLTAIPGKLGETAATEQRNLQTGTENQRVLDNLNEMAQNSEMRQISPEALADFVRRADADQNTQVYIDPAQLALYLREQVDKIPNDPALIILSDQVSEAVRTGADAAIPIDVFISTIAATPHYDALRESMTLDPNAVPTYRQEQAKKEAETYMSQLVEEAQQNVTQYAEAQTLYESVREQLIETGRVSERNAGIMAQIVPAWATVYSQKSGKSIAEIYAESGLTIVGPQTGKPTGLAQRAVDVVRSIMGIAEPMTQQTPEYTPTVAPDTQISSVQDTILGKTYTAPNGATISVREDSPYSPRPNSITEFVVPENLRGQGAGNQLLKQILQRYDPMTISAAASSKSSVALFYKNGFRPVMEPDATLDRSFEIMNEWSSVTMVVPEELGYQGQDTGEATEWVAAMQKFGAEGMTTEARMARAREMGFDTEQVLYHGTNVQIDAFEESKIGARDPGFFGQGVYFTPSEDVAFWYADSAVDADGVGESIVMPSYVKLEKPFVWDMSPGDGASSTRAALAALGIERSSVRGDSAALGNSEERRKFNKGLRDQGYDGVIVRDEDGVREIVVFNPSNIRSVNAAFDPDAADSANLLAQRSEKGARGYYDPNNAIIRLTEASDLSTFLHEFAHFMFEMERNLGGDTWNQIGQWFKRNAADVASEANGYLQEKSNLPPGVSAPSAKLFSKNLADAAKANPNGASVWVGDEADYAGMRRFTLDNGRVGFAIEQDGNLTGVFKHPDSRMRGAINTIVPLAVRMGARKLDAFEGNLTEMYSRFGFKEVGRAPFDPKLAPPNWNTQTMGTPDVVFMTIDEETANEIARQAAAQGLSDTDGVSAGTGTLEQQGRATLEPTREADGSLRGLPRNVGRFTAGHNKKIADVAKAYMESRGLPYNPPNTYASVDPERAARIAAAYDAMKHDPTNPEVMAAYEAMIEETIAQYEAVMAAGLQVEFIDFATQGDPYAESPRMAIDDIANNNHMWVFSTRDGFGSDDTFDPVDNPLLRETDFIISGQKALVNDLFRVVHDYFGHVKEGVGFRAAGEENAWRAHSAMYSPLARKAMTVETRGQNSWVNYGPYGETNRTASSAETHFADQKIGLLPDWVVTEGAGDTDVFLQSEDNPQYFEGPITPDDVTKYVDEGTTGNADKDAALNRATHEQFARGWEQYLMEGEAPSIELRNIFRTFARWLTEIYQRIRGGLRVSLDDEMRQVFDRLIATQQQIDAAQARNRVEPLFTSAAMMGKTEEEYQKYLEKSRKVKEVAEETLRDKMIKQLTRQTETWWRQERDDRALEERETLENTRVYRTINALRTGDMKLDKAVVKEMAGDLAVSRRGTEYVRVPRQLNNMTIDGAQGVHPDEAALFFGYSSGSEMLNDIIAAPSIERAAEQAADAYMNRRYGDILNDGSIEREADEALLNEQQAELIFDEIRALNRKVNIDRQNVKDMAAERISKMSYTQIHPQKYKAAEVRAAKEAGAMMAAGNKEGAAAAKMRQLMNHYLHKSAVDAKASIEKIRDDMARYDKKSVREAIMKAGNGYWEQLTKILSRFEFRKSVSMSKLAAANEAITTWAEKRISEDGAGLVLSPETLNEVYTTHWKNVPLTELQGIADSVKNIEHVARYDNKVKLAEEQREFNEIKDTWIKSIKEKVKTVYQAQRTTTVENKSWMKWAMAQMTKIPYMASWLDGGERVGLSHQLLVQGFTDAMAAKLSLYETAARPVTDAIANLSKETKKRYSRKVFIREIQDEQNDGNLFGHQIIAVALNTGNKSNLRKLLLGEGWANKDDETTISADNPKLQAVLKHMTKEDWDLVQLIWDQMDSLYPQLAEVHRRTTGLTPPKVEATPVQTPFGEYRGGYYPVKYDRNRSTRAELNEQRLEAQVDSMFSTDGSIQASVNASATSERTGYFAPINLNLDIVQNHFNEVIHYITFHDQVRQVNKMIRDPEIADAIKGALGPDEFNQLRPWLNDIAKDGRASETKTMLDSIFGRLRTGITLGYMGFKASTGIIQISGLSNATAEVGVANMIRATRMILNSPADTQSATEFAMANSKVLPYRMQTMDREMNSALQDLQGKTGFWRAVQEASMKHIAYIQTYMVDIPSWYAGYAAELERSGDEQKAYQYADWVVEQVQGSGATQNMSALLRNPNKTHRLFTMFMTFFSSLWNQERDLARGIRNKRYSVTTVAAKLMFLMTIPVLFDMWLRGDIEEPEDEDEDDRIQRMLSTTAMYAVGGVPFLREAANAAVGEFGYSMTPIAQVMEAGISGSKRLLEGTLTDEEIIKASVKGTTQLVGAFLGVPGMSQVWATGESLYKVLEEGEDITIREVLFGPERE